MSAPPSPLSKFLVQGNELNAMTDVPATPQNFIAKLPNAFCERKGDIKIYWFVVVVCSRQHI